MATDFENMVYDPVTGTTKKKTTLPYLNQNEASQGYLPYTGEQQPATATPNSQVLSKATQTALATPGSAPIQDQTTKMTQKLMTDPNLGRDFSKYNAGQMSKFDLDRASGVKAYQEANAGMGGSGQVQKGLIDLALSQNVNRGMLENDLEQQAYEQSMKNYLNAIAQGREQGEYIDTSRSDYLNNLLNVEKANIEKGRLGVETGRLGLESKELEGQMVELFGGMVDTNGDGVPDKQIFGKYDLLSNEDKREADRLYGYDIKDQTGNVVGHVSGTLQLEQDRVAIEQQGLDIDKAKILGYDKDTNGDGVPDTHVDGQLDIAMKQYGLDLDRLGIDRDTAYGYVDSQGNRVKGVLEIQVEKLAIEKMLAALEERQVDTKEVESIYNFIQNEVESGRASPDSALNYVNSVLVDNGITLEEADKNAIFDEIAQDFKVQQYQFALANPEYGQFDANGQFVGLTEDGTKAFGNFVGSTLYGETGLTQGGVDTTGYFLDTNNKNKITDQNGKALTPEELSINFRNANDPTNQNYDKYQEIVNSVETINPRISNKASNNIELGLVANVGKAVNSGGRLLVITKTRTRSTTGRNHDEFEVMDVATGQRRTFTGLSSGDDSVNNFNSWVASLG